MMKEIHEQPKAIQDTLNSVMKDGSIDLSGVEITEDEIKNFEQIYIVACGSAWHVGMAAQYVLEDMADIPVRVELASEFRYRRMPLIPECTCDRCQSVWRDSRYIGCTAYGKREWYRHDGNRQCGGQQYCP